VDQLHITKTSIEKLPFVSSGQKRYRDTKLTGFGVRVGAKTKAYYVEKKVHGKTVRVTLGAHGQITTDQARKMALETLGKMTAGVNPLDDKKTAKAKGVTLYQAYEDYRHERKGLKSKTLYDYDRIMEVAFNSWHKKPVTAISKDAVARKYKKLGEERGPAYANLSMRLLRALFNFAKARYEDSKGHSIIPDNPVDRISQAGGWYQIKRRETIIKPHEIAAWYTAVSNLQNATLKSYLLFLLFTGLRRQEAARLKWDQVDMKAKTVSIIDTKNDSPLTLPLSPFALDILKDLKHHAGNEYVFAGSGKEGYIIEPRAAIRAVTEESGIKFSIHDLRRTFITIASSLVTAYELKRLVNHKNGADVTAGYIVPDVEQLRGPMQKITDRLLSLCGLKGTGKIIQLKGKETG